MGLLSYTNLEDGFAATANVFNERFAAIYNAFNGNISADNLSNGAVTTPKLADRSVTAEKMATELYVDDNGWTVLDVGGIKTYTRQLSVSKLINGGGTRSELGRFDPPVGRTNSNVSVVATWYGGFSGHLVIAGETRGGQIAIEGGNIWPSALTFTGKVNIQATDII